MLRRYSIELHGKEHEVAVEALEGGRYRVIVNGREQVVDARSKAAIGASLSWSILASDGRQVIVDIDAATAVGSANDFQVTCDNVTAPAKVTDVRRKLAAAQTQGARRAQKTAILSPMPGKIVKVLVKVGDTVTQGQGVVVVEAMKMENELKAVADGKVKAVKVKEGEAVDASQSLVEFE